MCQNSLFAGKIRCIKYWEGENLNKFKKYGILCLSVSFLFCNFCCFSVYGSFSKDKYNVPEGKSIALSLGANYSGKKIKWISEDSTIVSVDSNGVAHAKKQGKAVIKAVDKHGKDISKCTVEVGRKDPFRIVYPSANYVSANEAFKIKAITYKNAELLKFEITGEKYSKTFECRTKSNYFDYYLWEHSVSLPHNGSYHIKALAKVGKSWQSCSEGNSDVFVSEKYNKKKSSLSEKMVSRECSDMIAAWEGSRQNAYKDVAGNLTIGYGKRIYPDEVFYNNLSPAEMSNMFLHTLNHSSYAKCVNKFLIDNKIKFNQHQFDALVSFSYNLGCGWLRLGSDLSKIILDCAKGGKTAYNGVVRSSNGLWVRSEPTTSSKKLAVLKDGEKVDISDPKKLNEKWYRVRTTGGVNGYCYGDYMELVRTKKGTKNLNDIDADRFAKEFLAYHHAGGKCNKGLFKRRVEELNMFFKGTYKQISNFKRSDVPYSMPECAKKLF